jgi:hypothetical protein
MVIGWYDQARRRLSLEASIRGVATRELACTLLAAVLDTECAVLSQIGDGAIIYRDGGGYQIAFWPQSGEYANTTNFLTDGAFEDHVLVRLVAPGPDGIALLTDGLQPLALHYATQTAHAPFFDPMLDALRLEMDPDRLRDPLNQFLASRAVCERTDDDKTLVLAALRPRYDDATPPGL